MTKRTARGFTVAFLTLMLSSQVVAAEGSSSSAATSAQRQAPASTQAGEAIRPEFTMRDCLNILTGLNMISGEGNVSKYKFSPATRDNISHNLFNLSQIQLEGLAANRRIQAEVRGDTEGQLSQRQLATLDERVNQYLDRKCEPNLIKLRKEDLDLERNDIPPSALSLIWRLFQ